MRTKRDVGFECGLDSFFERLDRRLLGGFGNLAGLDTAGTDLLALRATLGELDPNRLQIGIKPARRTIISVGHVVSELWTFATNFAAFSHYL